MADTRSKEGTLVGSVAQTWTTDLKCRSVVYHNDDATHTHAVILGGETFTVMAGEAQVFSGDPSCPIMTIGGDAGSVGAYRIRASTSNSPSVAIKPRGTSTVTADIADGAVTEAKIADPGPDSSAFNVARQVVFTVGFADMAAAADALLGPTFPDNAIVRKFAYRVDQTFTSATDAATIGIGFATDDPAGCVATIAISGVGDKWDAGWHDGIQDGATANNGEQLTAARQLKFVRGGAEVLTSGSATFFVDWVVGPA